MSLLLTATISVGQEYRQVQPKLALGFFEQFLVFCSPIYLAYYSSFEMDKPEIYLNNRHFPPVKLQLYSGQTLSDYLSDKFCLLIIHLLNKFNLALKNIEIFHSHKMIHSCQIQVVWKITVTSTRIKYKCSWMWK